MYGDFGGECEGDDIVDGGGKTVELKYDDDVVGGEEETVELKYDEEESSSIVTTCDDTIFGIQSSPLFKIIIGLSTQYSKLSSSSMLLPSFSRTRMSPFNPKLLANEKSQN